jgi:SAM-dependent methyltransferase
MTFASQTGRQVLSLPENLMDSRYDWAFSTLERIRHSLRTKDVLDIGAGDGLMKRIESLGLKWRGFDLNPDKPDVIRWNLTDPCPECDFEAGAAILLDVIEHCVNPGLALRHISDILPAGGYLILTTPNPRCSRSRTHTLAYGVPLCFTQADLDQNHHVFPPWPHILEKMLHDVDLHIEAYVTLDGWSRWPTRPLSLSFPIRCAHSLLTFLIEMFDHSARGMSYGLVARKSK